MSVSKPSLAVLIAVLSISNAVHADEMPRMRWDQPVQCLYDPDGQLVRVQCDDEAVACLITRRTEAERLTYCEYYGPSFSELTDKGYTFTEAIAEAPPGWWRDEEGRVFQVAFDMDRRLYLGGAYEPTWSSEMGRVAHRAAFDLGLLGWVPGLQDNVRHRFRAFEGRLRLEPLEVDATLLRWDRDHLREDPFLRFTTFFGTPARHDLHANIMWGLMVGRTHLRSVEEGVAGHLDLMGVHSGWALWQSENMVSSLRLRVGPLLRAQIAPEQGLTAPGVTLDTAVEGHWVVDRRGMNQVGFSVSYQHPWVLDPDADPSLEEPIVGGQAEWERILVALNDQPVSFVVGAGAFHGRNGSDNTEVTVSTGLRFSLWAPAPADAPVY